MNTLISTLVPDVGYRTIHANIGDYSFLEELFATKYTTKDLLESFLSYDIENISYQGEITYMDTPYVMHSCLPALVRAGKSMNVSRIYIRHQKWHALQILPRTSRWRDGCRYVPVNI